MRIAAENCAIARYVVLEFVGRRDSNLGQKENVAGNRSVARRNDTWTSERVVIPANPPDPINTDILGIR